ncbi:MAG: hypothetical protein ACYCOU_14755 [Sulfobacillus sp.]
MSGKSEFEPRAVSHLDEDLRGLVSRAIWIQRLVVVSLCIVVLGMIAIGIRDYIVQNERIAGSCAFFEDVGTVNVSTSGLNKSSEIGVRLVIDARNAFIEQGCPGNLGPPPENLKQLARHYHLHLDY